MPISTLQTGSGQRSDWSFDETWVSGNGGLPKPGRQARKPYELVTHCLTRVLSAVTRPESRACRRQGQHYAVRPARGLARTQGRTPRDRMGTPIDVNSKPTFFLESLQPPALLDRAPRHQPSLRAAAAAAAEEATAEAGFNPPPLAMPPLAPPPPQQHQQQQRRHPPEYRTQRSVGSNAAITRQELDGTGEEWYRLKYNNHVHFVRLVLLLAFNWVGLCISAAIFVALEGSTVVPGRLCSPRHRMSFDSTFEGCITHWMKR